MSERDRSAERIEVMIVDDHPAICDALESTINRAMGMSVSAKCPTSDEAMAHLRSSSPDVAVIDISLEDSYGLDLLYNIRSQHPETQVVVFSMYDEKVYAERSIRGGAMGYVMKSQPTEDVIEAIRSASEDQVYLSSGMATHILNRLPRDDSKSSGFAIDSLTDRELAVFQMLGRGYSVPDITERLNLGRKTVETYRRRAKEKLNLDSTSELLQFAVEWTHGQGSPERVEHEE